MKNAICSVVLILSCTTSIFSQTDVEKCKDSPLFQTRMPNYFISKCDANFDIAEFKTAAGEKSIILKEGTHTGIQYNFNSESGATKPSVLEILRNYEAAAKSIGGVTVYLNASEALAVFKILKNDVETAWVKVECGGNDNNDFYVLTIIQLEAMTQEVTSYDNLMGLTNTINSSPLDVEKCKDLPMFPTRMKNYFISECKSDFETAEFIVGADGSIVSKEGTHAGIQYQFNYESGASKPSVWQILKNYENAIKSIGGTTVFMKHIEGFAVFKIMRNDAETVWVKVECGGDDGNTFYNLTTIQLEPMIQEVTADYIFTTLNNTSRVSLNINFATGKSDIDSDAQIIIDQIAAMLNANPTLKICIEGHTDNVGGAAANQSLSEDRALAVMNALIAKGIDRTRLTSKGLGQTKPIADNGTDAGKAENRRVEIVKI